MSAARNRPRPALADPALDRRLRRDGFAVFPLLSPAEVAELRAVYERLNEPGGEGFLADLQRPDPAYKRAVREALSSALGDRVAERFVDHRPFLFNFLCKHPGPGSELYVHRDWMYVDGRAGHRTYVAWVALQDVLGANGRLRVLRGSHVIEDGFRGTDIIAPWLRHEDVIEARLRSLRVRAGDCVVMDNALTHSSYPNLTDEPRLVAAVGMRPTAAPLVYFHRHDATTAHRYDIDEQFFIDHTPQELLEAPPDLPVAEVVPDNQLDVSAEELAAILDRNPRTRIDAVARRLAGARPQDAVRSAALFAPGSRRGPGRGPVRSVLVVSSSPDDRRSTATLHDIVTELAARPGLRVHTWFMTAPDPGRVWDGARALDQPFGSAALDRLASLPVGRLRRRLRGVRRLAWLAAARPDAIIFDDGLGEPLVRRMSRSHVRVDRVNPLPPPIVPADLRSPVGDADLVIGTPSGAWSASTRHLEAPEVFVRPPRSAAELDGLRRAARERLGIGPDQPVVVGSGRHGWVDGADLFPRVLWTLRHRHGIDAHGVWIASHLAIDEAAPLEAEAARCGLDDRFDLVDDPRLVAAADVAVLPCRDAAPAADAGVYIESGIPVISFPVWAFEHPLLEVVPHLDLDAVADAAARQLLDPGRTVGAFADSGYTVHGWVDRFVAELSACRR